MQPSSHGALIDLSRVVDVNDRPCLSDSYTVLVLSTFRLACRRYIFPLPWCEVRKCHFINAAAAALLVVVLLLGCCPSNISAASDNIDIPSVTARVLWKAVGL